MLRGSGAFVSFNTFSLIEYIGMVPNGLNKIKVEDEDCRGAGSRPHLEGIASLTLFSRNFTKSLYSQSYQISFAAATTM